MALAIKIKLAKAKAKAKADYIVWLLGEYCARATPIITTAIPAILCHVILSCPIAAAANAEMPGMRVEKMFAFVIPKPLIAFIHSTKATHEHKTARDRSG